MHSKLLYVLIITYNAFYVHRYFYLRQSKSGAYYRLFVHCISLKFG